MARENKKPDRTKEETPLTISDDSKSNIFYPIPAIMLLGDTGVGKSTFISIAGKNLKIKPEIGHGLGPCTQSVTKYDVEDPIHPERLVCLIDTPGFNDEGAQYDDYDRLGSLIGWLEKQPQSELAGILYFMDIGQARITKCPGRMNPATISNPPAVCVVTVKWSQSRSQRKKEENKEIEIQHKFCVPPNAMKRFENGNEEQSEKSAWEIINAVQDHTSKVSFQRVKELLEVIRPHVKHRKKFMDRVGRWFAKLFDPRV